MSEPGDARCPFEFAELLLKQDPDGDALQHGDGNSDSDSCDDDEDTLWQELFATESAADGEDAGLEKNMCRHTADTDSHGKHGKDPTSHTCPVCFQSAGDADLCDLQRIRKTQFTNTGGPRTLACCDTCALLMRYRFKNRSVGAMVKELEATEKRVRYNLTFAVYCAMKSNDPRRGSARSP